MSARLSAGRAAVCSPAGTRPHRVRPRLELSDGDVVAVGTGRQHGTEQPQEGYEDADDAEHQVALAEADQRDCEDQADVEDRECDAEKPLETGHLEHSLSSAITPHSAPGRHHPHWMSTTASSTDRLWPPHMSRLCRDHHQSDPVLLSRVGIRPTK